MKRATRLFSNFPRSSCDFNPRPHEEGDSGDFVNNVIRLFISIHALMKRATDKVLLRQKNLFISIHALMKRATKDVFCGEFDGDI